MANTMWDMTMGYAGRFNGRHLAPWPTALGLNLTIRSSVPTPELKWYDVADSICNRALIDDPFEVTTLTETGAGANVVFTAAEIIDALTAGAGTNSPIGIVPIYGFKLEFQAATDDVLPPLTVTATGPTLNNIITAGAGFTLVNAPSFTYQVSPSFDDSADRQQGTLLLFPGRVNSGKYRYTPFGAYGVMATGGIEQGPTITVASVPTGVQVSLTLLVRGSADMDEFIRRHRADIQLWRDNAYHGRVASGALQRLQADGRVPRSNFEWLRSQDFPGGAANAETPAGIISVGRTARSSRR